MEHDSCFALRIFVPAQVKLYASISGIPRFMVVFTRRIILGRQLSFITLLRRLIRLAQLWPGKILSKLNTKKYLFF